MKGSAMKTVWVCMLLVLLSTFAYSGFSDAPGGAQPLFEMLASPSIAATHPSAPVGAIALDATSRSPAPGSTSNDHVAANLATYLFLHKTWNESISAPATGGSNVCPE